jgi:hypothetical protein
MFNMLVKVIPIILLMMIGYIIKVKNLIKNESIRDINKIVINISLPAILFNNFLTMKLEKEYLLIVLINILLLIMLYYIGTLINKTEKFSHPLNPLIVTGFSFGLLGIPLFRTVFGAENLGNLLILGISNEIFIWFIFFPLIKLDSSKNSFSFNRIIEFFKSPITLAIIFGILFNILGYESIFKMNNILKGIYETFVFLGDLATPLILIGIGYGLSFTKKYMKTSIKLVLFRLFLILFLGYIFKFLFINKIMTSTNLFNYAFFTFLILPPPFALPILISEIAGKNDLEELANNTVMLSTVTSVLIYIFFVFLISNNL